MKVKLGPKGVESSLVPDNFHPECCLFSNVEVQLLGEDFLIGKVEVLRTCYDVLVVLDLLRSNFDGLVIRLGEVVGDSGLWDLNMLILLFLGSHFFKLIIEKELGCLWRQFDRLFFFTLFIFFSLDFLFWLLLRSPSPLRPLFYISISNLNRLLGRTIKTFNLIFDFLNTVFLYIILKDLYLVTLLYWCKSTSINKYFICCFLSRLALGSSFIFLSLYFFWETGLILLGEDGAT